MSRNSKRGCLIGAAIVIAGGLLAALLLYRSFSRQVNLAGTLGGAAEAAVVVPAGFQVNVFASGLDNPRFMAVGPDGQLYVAERGRNRIVALPDADGDGVADEVRLFAGELNSPHSLVYHEGRWFVGVPTGIVALVDEDGDGTADQQTTLVDDYPTAGHSTRTVAFLPDGRLAVSIGSSCNVCVEEDARRAAIVVYDVQPDGSLSGERVYAGGLRNAVGLDIHPLTGELWASNNGRDLLGDDLPPETVYVVRDGADYGWPYCHSGSLVDPDLGFDGACAGVEAPVVAMQAHSAPLGIAFYAGTQFPAGYQGDLFIAFHGSWNRSEPTGYKIVRLDLVDGVPAGAVTDFATGWLLADGTVVGRPAGVTVGADGALYISDDKGGYIYRISYTGQTR